ncbi:hypothetical protein VIGAN_04270700, partial [Vigna angularis var. angularis]
MTERSQDKASHPGRTLKSYQNAKTERSKHYKTQNRTLTETSIQTERLKLKPKIRPNDTFTSAISSTTNNTWTNRTNVKKPDLTPNAQDEGERAVEDGNVNNTERSLRQMTERPRH